ncbi:MAG TPA: LysM peptidoglycan-binding domain-containing protein [Acidimicrobiales bacterium]|nr:LysM peptidoglycan-binding domain-containing protein [Acidimicrobiales bacterium]
MRSNIVKFLLGGISLLIISACGGGDEEPVLVPATIAPTTTIMDLSTTVPMTTTSYATPSTIVPVVIETTTTTIVVEPEETEPEPVESVTVTAGDSLSEIAKANGTTAEKLARINGICNVNSIYVGQVILLNDPEQEVETDTTEESLRTVIVETGDSLSKIAKREGVTVDEVMSMNNISDPNLLFVGQKLTISGQASPEPQEEDPVC